MPIVAQFHYKQHRVCVTRIGERTVCIVYAPSHPGHFTVSRREEETRTPQSIAELMMAGREFVEAEV